MEGSDSLSVTIVNRNYPPSKGIISESPSDLAKHLTINGFDVHVVHTDGNYAGGGGMSEVVGTVHKVKSVYDGKNKLIRLAASMIEGFKLIRKARAIKKGPVIVMTAPALLNFWASWLFRKSKTPWIYWSMDLFPEAFVAGNLIGKKNPIYKFFLKQSYKYSPTAMIPLGEMQGQYLERSFKKEIRKSILPCGILLHQKNGNEKNQIPTWKTNKDKIYIGYIGNLGEAHSVDFLKYVIDNADTNKHHLIFVLYGSKAQKIKDYIKNKPGIQLFDFIPREELIHIDLHLVSLEPEWVHLCVPSKLLSAVHKKGVFLFYGIAECDSWQYLKDAGWLIEKGNDEKDSVKQFLDNLTKEQIQEKKSNSHHLSALLEQNTVDAYDNIVKMVKEIA